MTAPEQQATDPRQPAWDAVFAYIRTLSRDALPGSIVERNAVIWRAVNAALVALGYPDADTQHAAPEQADLHQRLETALRPVRWVAFTADDGHRATRDASPEELAAAVLAALQPELAELAALREQLAAAQAENARLRDGYTLIGWWAAREGTNCHYFVLKDGRTDGPFIGLHALRDAALRMAATPLDGET